MAFKFNFSLQNEDVSGDIGTPIGDVSCKNSGETKNSLLCNQLEAASEDKESSPKLSRSCKKHNICLGPNFSDELSITEAVLPLQKSGKTNSCHPPLWYLSSNSVDMLLKRRAASQDINVLKDLIEHSDLRSGVYEGGFKVWECSIDLIEYLQSCNFSWNGKDVLELGCGGGLPAIYCLLNGSNTVYFQDFNEEVIDCFTIPNMFVNIEKHGDRTFEKNGLLGSINDKTAFLSGDWRSVCDFLQEKNKKFDLILSSETIYNTNYYQVFHDLICSSMKENGHALLANKSYYFGVGGSSKDFVEFVDMQDKLCCETLHQITDGVNRDILKLTWK